MATVATIRSTPPPPPGDMQAAQPPATPTSTPALAIPGDNDSPTTPVAIPNKIMATPNPGGVKFTTSPVTPPASPPDSVQNGWMESLLYPPEDFTCINRSPPLYSIDAAAVAAALHFMSRQPLPDIDQLFPWAHGLHPDNTMQLSFFYARKGPVRRTPVCFRGICVVKAGKDLTTARLKGAILSNEILPPNPMTQGFLNLDPREGYSARNFHIQVAKFAGLCDIIVYGDDETDPEDVLKLAKRISTVQKYYREKCQTNAVRDFPKYSTFVVKSPFSVFEELFPEIVTVDSRGNLTGHVVDFCHWERMEMCSMSRASEITSNVFLGSNADCDARLDDDSKTPFYGLLIEANDLAQMPKWEQLRDLLEVMAHTAQTQLLEFPGSGTISPVHWSKADVNGLISTCRWIYAVANGQDLEDDYDTEGDHRMITPGRGPRKVLIHCTDGYTETSLLALAYIMYAELLPVHEAWVKLHTTKKRNFFAYEKDLTFLRYIEHTILEAGAKARGTFVDIATLQAPQWLYRMDGSLPSRILPYMYLGNLQHANNSGLLVRLGIKRVLSIGEELSWSKDEKAAFGKDKTMVIRDLQDNGCDPLEYQFLRCLEFIDAGHRMDEPILVHCRVGVSRSATICIAEVMRSLKLSLPRAYCYVRARRLNVIIQPHLRFMYELLKFEETLAFKACHTPKRELEWMHVAREIATMNRPYTRQS